MARALRKGQKERAVRLARHYVRFYPADPNSWRVLGQALLETEAYEEADLLIREALKRHSNDQLWHLLVRVMILTDRWSEARQVLDTMAANFPDSPLPYLGMSDVAAFERDWIKARDYALTALDRASPVHRWTYFEVARRLACLPGEESRAIELLIGASRKMPREPLPHAMLAILIADSDPNSSQEHVAAARQLLGGDEQVMQKLLSDVRWSLGRDLPQDGAGAPTSNEA